MRYLIACLGNPGAEYARTRHNVGWLVADELAGDTPWQDKRHGWVCEVKHRGRTLVLLKPTTYMNLSGKAVNYWMKELKIPAPNVLAITDDLALDFGTVRLRGQGSAGGHNGLKDIEATLGHNQYARMRVGIGSHFRQGQQVDYVLGSFSAEEEKALPAVLGHCAEAARSFAFVGLQQTMTQFNKTLAV
ncbi:MAG: aminoacyl-tRNA hydrolase [Bacteroidetes bacterium]|nr:aminoacyl-tRNA hydrolase [Bacteroidota bacterium]